MALHGSLLVARLLWVIPGIMLFLTLNQALVALDLRETVREGRLVEADVLAFNTTDRADITMASVHLRVPMADGATLERELPLPITFVRTLEGRAALDVFVDEGADQEIVIAEIGRAQWRLAAINGAISLVGLFLVSWGIFAWNRYLGRKGDPARAGA
jgi:hypothetical protein